MNWEDYWEVKIRADNWWAIVRKHSGELIGASEGWTKEHAIKVAKGLFRLKLYYFADSIRKLACLDEDRGIIDQ